jgi:hypothetical protein
VSFEEHFLTLKCELSLPATTKTTAATATATNLRPKLSKIVYALV